MTNEAKIVLEDEQDRTEKVFELKAKTFRTGSVGYHAFGKMETPGGKRYQINIIVVEIGSKERRDK